ncbi:hypothetical protein [Actinoplanes aureus]|uniref:PKD domain-containing protein n=1 Tax=Actinoplanes aureus TaxID=2792083 RepID=A0A931CIQ6_9ACTN|nr:hypothetical protein [Actinoplanes aureus]MBG0568402.1 hypothetical protein [Actinoplanes aureus]
MVQPRRVKKIVGLTLGAAVLGGAAVTVATLASGEAAPDGPYRLTSYSIWAGQSTTLLRSSASGDSTQVIDWGDGTTETVPGSTTQVPHTYQSVGTFTPTVTVSGGTRESAGRVTVSTVIGGYQVKQSTTWIGDAVTLAYQTYEEADNIKISWGDGQTSVVEASVAEATTTHAYAAPGTFEVTVAPVNENGAATPRAAGTVTAKKDATGPIVTLTTPANPASGRSWATLTGKASDDGVGVRSVTLTAVVKRGQTWFAYTGAGWRKVASRAAATRRTRAITVAPDASGAWRAPFQAPAKGTMRFTYTAIDKAGNRSVAKAAVQRITA